MLPVTCFLLHALLENTKLGHILEGGVLCCRIFLSLVSVKLPQLGTWYASWLLFCCALALPL
jgi:hypothetical protein